MEHSIRPRFLLVCGALAAVCVAAAGILLNWTVRQITHGKWPPRWLPKLARATVLAVALAAVLCGVYAWFIEPNWLAVERVPLASAHLPAGTPAIRIVQISDLHCEAEPRLEDRVAEVIESERPDLIFFTGDAINGEAGVPVLREFLGRVAKVAPTFAIFAHGDGPYAPQRLLAGTGAQLATPEGVICRVGQVSVRVLGNVSRPPRIPETEGSAAFTVLLQHYPPDAARMVKGSRVDLCLAGNTHGGQIRLPLLGSMTGSRADREYLAGLYRVGRTWLYVSRGIGMTGSGPPVRFGARPEVTVFEIRPAK